MNQKNLVSLFPVMPSINMSDLMKNVYYTPSNSGSLGSKTRLKQAVLEDTGVRLSDQQVSEW